MIAHQEYAITEAQSQVGSRMNEAIDDLTKQLYGKDARIKTIINIHNLELGAKDKLVKEISQTLKEEKAASNNVSYITCIAWFHQ